MMRRPGWFLACLFAACTSVLSACGGGGGGTSPAAGGLPSTGGSPASQGSATATIAVTLQQYTPVVTSAKRRHAAFVSPATAEISLAVAFVNGVATTGAAMTFPISPTAQGCAGTSGIVTCTLSADIPVGTDVLSASTLDANGHTLGTSSITATVVQNATNRIALSVGGQIANLQLYLSQSQFTSGTAGTANVIVVPLDASGAQIVNPGDYDPPVTVTSSNAVSGHVSLITDGTNTGRSATILSPNDQVVVSYDGVATSGNTTITATAGSGITASKNISVSAQGLYASPSGAQYVTANSYIFTAAGQTGTISVGGGTGPYTVVSSDPTLASISGTGPYTITAVGYGVSGTATITVHDSLSAQTTIPVTFLAPPIVLASTSCGSGATCTASGATYTIPLTGPPASIAPSTVTATGGVGTYAYVFASTGTTTSVYATVAQSGGAFTITPSGLGNDALIIASGNQTAYYTISAGADAFAQSLPSAIGLVIEGAVGKSYYHAEPATVTSISTTSGASFATFTLDAGPAISTIPTAAGVGNLRFFNAFGGQADVPFTVFGVAFSTYQGAGAAYNAEATIPADEQFTGAGETDTVTITGVGGTLSASSSNPSVATVSTVGDVLTVTSVAAGTANIILQDSGTGAVAMYSLSVTITTIPIASTQRSAAAAR